MKRGKKGRVGKIVKMEGQKDGKRKQEKDAGKAGLYGTSVWLYTVQGHHKGQGNPLYEHW